MIPKQAITKAIEGEWHPANWEDDWQMYALDPDFWRALGKVLGLGDDWQGKAHGFYDLILTDSDTSKFWEELLK